MNAWPPRTTKKQHAARSTRRRNAQAAVNRETTQWRVAKKKKKCRVSRATRLWQSAAVGDTNNQRRAAWDTRLLSRGGTDEWPLPERQDVKPCGLSDTGRSDLDTDSTKRAAPAQSRLRPQKNLPASSVLIVREPLAHPSDHPSSITTALAKLPIPPESPNFSRQSQSGGYRSIASPLGPRAACPFRSNGQPKPRTNADGN